MANQHHHHDWAQQQLGGDVEIHAGMNDDSRDFQALYQLNPPFDLNCAGCCFQYLVQGRNYQLIRYQARIVKHHNANTSCFVAGPQGNSGVHGVIKTLNDLNLGRLGPRTVQRSHSYQLYGPQAPAGLAVGAQMVARIEAIAINQVTQPVKVQDCYFNYTDAALIELYREQEGEQSLAGQCCWPREPAQGELDKPAQEGGLDKPAQEGGLDKLASEMTKMTVKD